MRQGPQQMVFNVVIRGTPDPIMHATQDWSFLAEWQTLCLAAGPPSSVALAVGSAHHELASIFGKTMSKQGMMKLQAVRDALKERPFLLLTEVLAMFAVGLSASVLLCMASRWIFADLL